MKNFGKKDSFENLRQIIKMPDSTTDEIDQTTVTVGRILSIGQGRLDGLIILSQEEADISKTIFENLRGKFRLEIFVN